jgi:MFS family permease
MPSRLSTLLGIPTLLSTQRDIHILYLSRFLRTAAFGSTGLILAVYLSQLGHSDVRIGLFMTLTLAGDVFLSLMLTNWADRLGRRRTMPLGAFLMIVSGIVFATASNYWILLLAAVFGVISPSGNEIGPFRAIEEGTLASLTDEDSRSDIFAWHIVAGTLGVASGTFSAGWVISGLQKLGGLSELESYRGIFVLYATLGLVKLLVATRLSTACELDVRKSNRRQHDGEEAEGMLGPGGLQVQMGRPAWLVLERTLFGHLFQSSRVRLGPFYGGSAFSLQWTRSPAAWLHCKCSYVTIDSPIVGID